MTPSTSVIVPQEVERDIATRQAWAKHLVIRTPDQRTDSMDVLRAVKERTRTVLESFDASVKAAYAAHKAIVAQRDTFLAPLKEIEAGVKLAVGKYDAEQERIRQEEERRINAIAQERQRKEQERIDALARAQREKEEAARKAEAEARQRAQEAASAEARALALAEAEKARKAAAAAAAKATEREEQAATLPPAPVLTVAKVAPKADGESAARVWKYRIIDPALIPSDYWMLDESKIGAVVRATKGTVKIPGIETYSENSIRMRT